MKPPQSTPVFCTKLNIILQIKETAMIWDKQNLLWDFWKVNSLLKEASFFVPFSPQKFRVGGRSSNKNRNFTILNCCKSCRFIFRGNTCWMHCDLQPGEGFYSKCIWKSVGLISESLWFGLMLFIKNRKSLNAEILHDTLSRNIVSIIIKRGDS